MSEAKKTEKKVVAEIWVGGLTYPAHKVEVKSLRASIDGTSVLITATDGTEYVVSPHNLVVITTYKTEGKNKSDIGEGKEFFSPQEVRAMSREDIRKNYSRIIESMKRWG